MTLVEDFNKENKSMNHNNQKTPAQERMYYRLQGQKREATRLIGRMTFRDFLHKSFELTEDLVMDGIFEFLIGITTCRLVTENLWKDWRLFCVGI